MTDWDTLSQPTRTAKEGSAPICPTTGKNLNKQAFLRLAQDLLL